MIDEACIVLAPRDARKLDVEYLLAEPFRRFCNFMSLFYLYDLVVTARLCG